jgi:hypothetical protein
MLFLSFLKKKEMNEKKITLILDFQTPQNEKSGLPAFDSRQP